MAIDELLLSELRMPWLRWYEWDCPTVSIGYFEKPPELDESRPIVRRWTGGGLVEHGGPSDYTFSLGIPSVSGEPMRRPATSYHRIHSALLEVIRQCGIDAELVSHASRDNPKEEGCFLNPVAADIISSSGTKIAGGAQRRSKAGMLHQGSIQGVELPSKVRRLFAEILAESWVELPMPSSVIDQAVSLADARYGDLSP